LEALDLCEVVLWCILRFFEEEKNREMEATEVVEVVILVVLVLVMKCLW